MGCALTVARSVWVQVRPLSTVLKAARGEYRDVYGLTDDTYFTLYFCFT